MLSFSLRTEHIMAHYCHHAEALRVPVFFSRRNVFFGCFVLFLAVFSGTAFVPKAEAHTFDASSHQTRTRNTSGVTFNHTCGSGTTLLTLTIVVGGTTARTGGAPTYNGVSMTQADQNGQAPSGAETIVELWYLLNPGTGSAYQINIPDSNNVYLTADASSYKATSGYKTVLKTDDDNGNTSVNPTGPSLTGLVSGDVLVAVVGSGATTWAPSARTGTQLYDVDDGSYGDGAQYLIKTDSSDTAMGWTFGTSDDWSVVEAAFTEISPIEQEGFRFRNDDGSESAATWMQNQDTNASQYKNTNVRLRMLLDTPSDPISIPFRLEYKKSTESVYKKVLASESGSSTHAFVNSKRWKGNGSPSARAFDCGTDATLLVLTIVGTGTIQRAGGAPTYNGVSMTQADQTRGGATGYETSAELWYLIDPPSGANTISVPNTGAITLYATASSYSAGDGYTSAFDASGFSESTAGANPSASVSASVAGDVYVAVLGDGLATAPTARTGTALAEVDDGAYSDNHQYYIKAGTGSQTISWTIASDDYAMVVAAFKVVAVSQPILLGDSSYISAGGGTNTTAQLTAPSGKTTSNFTAGYIQDDTNPSNSVDIANNFYTEMEWSLKATDTAIVGDVYQFRITRNGTPIYTYSVTPQLTIIGATISITGSANGSNGSTVKVAINGTLKAQTGTISSGTWSISGVSEPTSGDVVTVWIDSVSDSAEAIGVTKYAGSNITGMVLNALTFSLGSSDNQTISNTNISQYDNSVSGNEDIFYDVDGNDDLTACSASGSTSCTLSVLSGNTYRSDSGSSGNITAENLSNSGALTLDGNTLYVSSSLTSSGTFNANISTVDFNGAGSQTIPALNYNNLTSSSTGVRVLANSGTIGIASTFTPGSNSYTITGSTVNFNGSSAQTVNADFTYNNLQVEPSANSITTNFAAGTVTVNGDLTIGNGTNTSVVVNANNASTTLTVAGSVSISANTTLQANASNSFTIGDDFTNNGTFTHNNGTVVFNDNTKISSLNYSANTTFYNLSITTGGKTVEFDESQGTIVTHAFTVTGSGCTTGRVFLKSVTNGNQWDITVTGATVSVSYADVHDGNAVTTAITASNSTADNDNNTNWTINGGACGGNANPDAPTSLTQKNSSNASISESAWTTTNTPKLGFTITDPDTDTVKYEVQVATDSGFSALVLDYTHGSFSASGTTFEFIVGTYGSGSCSGTCPSTLSDSATGYWWRVKAIDSNSAESAYVEFGVAGTMDFKVDATAPTGGTVNDGTSGDENWNNGTLTSLSSNWSGFDANVSGLNTYEYAIRRASDDYYWSVCSGAGSWQASANWCDNSTSTSYTQSSLNLATGTTYYTSVRATDNAGNVGTAVNSNGEQVLPTLSFSLSTNTITFSNLNNGNSYTDTKTLTVTTSTNASSGYTVKAYNTANLTSLENPSDTVGNFSGNWSTPLTWSGGTYGFGYTSSDTDVQGSNRFGGGTKYAAFTQSSPGDVVADHTSAIDGSTGAVSNEQFTVTYKVSVSNAQPAATYQTSSVYIVTANY
ncbi:MAG: hypothetical protein IPK84_03610 [Candidatus Moraniibacteriota bacterium]|nr:MAG: hypothetical protein IPK84_03610 [Candidatus Moranbacteria bacterium]